jgi:hypothetical protein
MDCTGELPQPRIIEAMSMDYLIPEPRWPLLTWVSFTALPPERPRARCGRLSGQTLLKRKKNYDHAC